MTTSQDGRVPYRLCVGCRQRDLRTVLVRLVIDQSVTPLEVPLRVVADLRKVLPGRGAWIHLNQRCLDQAERRRAVARALQVSGSVNLTAVRAAIVHGETQERPSRTDPLSGRSTSDVDKEAG